VLLAALAAPAAWAQPAGDPVERLRTVLKSSSYDATTRDQAVKECLVGLRSLGELGRAAALAEWREQSGGPIADVDRVNRTFVLERLGAGLRAVLQRGDPTASQVAIDLLCDLGRTAKARGEHRGLAGGFAPDLAEAAAVAGPRVRASVARALGQIEATPAAALPTLADLVKDPNADVRSAAAEGLNNFLQSTAEPAILAGDAQMAGARREAVEAAAGVARAARPGLADEVPEIRRGCLHGLASSALVLGKLIADPPRLDLLDIKERSEAQKTMQDEAEELRPLVLALAEQVNALAERLSDGDAEARLQAHKALEELAGSRQRWLRYRFGCGAADDPLGGALQAALPGLTAALHDPDVRVRRTALGSLELLGALAASTAPALTAALADPDRFVRWSAARTLGNLGAAARLALPGLTHLLEDPDLDVRTAAVAALDKLGLRDPPAQGSSKWAATRRPSATALPELLKTLQAGDAELRMKVLHTLGGIGGDAKPAVPEICQALRDSDVRVREAAAETLGALGPVARAALEPLKQAFRDPAPEVRRAAGDAILEVTGP
jgi:HEAT repeat protein